MNSIKKIYVKLKMRRKFRKTFPRRCKNGVCMRSGKCCSNLLQLNIDDVKRIKKYLAVNKIEPEEKHIVETRPGVFVESCPFLDTNNGSFENTSCRIHEIRPKVCRDFICDDKIMVDKYLSGDDIIPNEIGIVDLRVTFFQDK